MEKDVRLPNYTRWQNWYVVFQNMNREELGLKHTILNSQWPLKDLTKSTHSSWNFLTAQ